MWAILCLTAACAADAGDPLKTPMDESGPGMSGELDGSSGGGGGEDDQFGDGAPSPGMDTGTVVVGDDSGGGPPDSGPGGGQPEAAPDTSTGLDANAAPETSIDGGCLQSIPTSCPDCVTQNPPDVPVCQRYLACFANNNCNPNTACGTNSGICGVNTVGGGEAPYTAAVTTYNCACQ
ncbi:MAG: hypothetical protein ACLP1X_27855 [Polyangiaceae bacterium]